jgi:hypothetical protein
MRFMVYTAIGFGNGLQAGGPQVNLYRVRFATQSNAFGARYAC